MISKKYFNNKINNNDYNMFFIKYKNHSHIFMNDFETYSQLQNIYSQLD